MLSPVLTNEDLKPLGAYGFGERWILTSFLSELPIGYCWIMGYCYECEDGFRDGIRPILWKLTNILPERNFQIPN